jgi:Skp family chaperone for outer membrane proteins
MKTFTLLLIAAFFCDPVSLVAAEKIATVDVKLLFENYWRSKETEEKVNVLRGEKRREFDAVSDELKSLEEDILKMNRRIRQFGSNALILREREFKIAAWQSVSTHKADLTQNSEQLIKFQEKGYRDRMTKEINEVIDDFRRAEGYDLIFDSSGNSPNTQVPVVFRSAQQFDITWEILAKLNAMIIVRSRAENPPQLPSNTSPAFLSNWLTRETVIAAGLLASASLLLRVRQKIRPSRA